MYAAGTSVMARNAFYNFIFSKVKESKDGSKAIAGCNFWGWGGEGRPKAKEWKIGHDFLCDPPHEPQGWYSVFDTDTTTIDMIRETADYLKK